MNGHKLNSVCIDDARARYSRRQLDGRRAEGARVGTVVHAQRPCSQFGRVGNLKQHLVSAPMCGPAIEGATCIVVKGAIHLRVCMNHEPR